LWLSCWKNIKVTALAQHLKVVVRKDDNGGGALGAASKALYDTIALQNSYRVCMLIAIAPYG
jgi:hypothetical protein